MINPLLRLNEECQESVSLRPPTRLSYHWQPWLKNSKKKIFILEGQALFIMTTTCWAWESETSKERMWAWSSLWRLPENSISLVILTPYWAQRNENVLNGYKKEIEINSNYACREDSLHTWQKHEQYASGRLCMPAICSCMIFMHML